MSEARATEEKQGDMDIMAFMVRRAILNIMLQLLAIHCQFFFRKSKA